MEALLTYTKKRSPIHRVPTGIKILFLLGVPITVQLTPPYVCLSLMAVFPAIALMSNIGFKRFLRDLRPIVAYSLMIVSIDVLSYLIFDRNRAVITNTSLHLIIKLICAMEVASVFFRTTSTYQIRESLGAFERLVTFGHTRCTVSRTFTLFLGFLPRIFQTWTDLELAYKARGGRNGIRKVVKLLPLLITMSIKRASTTYLALLNRS